MITTTIDGQRMISEIVPSALAGERLDRIVAFVADISRSNAAATIAAAGVRVDGVAAVSGKVRLVEGQLIEVDESTIPRVPLPVADPSVEFDVVHEDATVIVVDKPAALVVHPGAGNMEGTLVHGLLARYPDLAGVGEPTRPGIVHRLDAGSSGLLVVARTQAASDALDRPVRVAHREPSLRGARVGSPGRRARHRRRSDRTRPTRPAPDGRRRRRPAGPHRVLAGRTVRRAGRVGAARVPSRNRPHPPDPRPPRSRSGTRSSATRRMANGDRRSVSSVRSSTPPSWPSTTRRPVSGSSSAPSSPPTSPTCSPPSRRPPNPPFCLRQTRVASFQADRTVSGPVLSRWPARALRRGRPRRSKRACAPRGAGACTGRPASRPRAAHSGPRGRTRRPGEAHRSRRA